ncbi:DUF1150 family protein [Rhodospirillum rubrum]|uniref:DUF1150 family protein n=1 Tax=Rhodospirillum rubrum (strain ATCC 11170 / ATH 1.1.1 / DSM 467 / LMG 4362 / NCIMB 8255 / S1) TaxID=269796 RepID=Q2RMU7_RHORT|nr:DUF1150 family protein [Rhodospirillum rubrum]ABC24548.1 hypothetical protein Rru_A3754 [Rhodospirillum rubrum ATCC 11170]AEO50301.1 hypothetical protein F11_19205 [Rhodospirillum rubrum F11]MBK5956273.1 hypothetical protein [Rhodospirillum rubrum]QXG80464.1 DUF1150 domain-containing protein [Rhodospirillum rubrum]HAP99218.1 DUF1150 domain-containing protein [Rhodospirillum rubrum]
MSDKNFQESAEHPAIPGPANIEELAVLGLNALAYARAATAADAQQPIAGFTIHAANGLRIGWAPSLDLAHVAIRQHDMQPMPLH